MKSIVSIAIVCTAVLVIAGTLAAEPKIKGKTIKYTVQGVEMQGYLAHDESFKGKRPAVLIVHEWWGLNEYARKRARMLAELGYTAFAVDMYGSDKVAVHPDDAAKFSSELMRNFDVAKARFTAAVDILKVRPIVDPDRIAAIGYCFGGGVVLNMARQGLDLKGVASFHGGLAAVKPALPGMVKAKVLVLNGAADTFITVDQIDKFKGEMTSAGANMKFISYPGAKHGFTNPEADEMAKTFNMPIGYNADADRQSWEELKTFLKDVFGQAR